MHIQNWRTSLYEYRCVQAAAKQVLEELSAFIDSTSTERTIALYAAGRLSELGFSETWYHSCPAFVLAGNRSCLSLSGREYAPTNDPVGRESLVSVDLSPCSGSIWGDCARSYIVENGCVSATPTNPELCRGVEAERYLHAEMRKFVNPDVSFHTLHEFANDLITSIGFVNLDFLGNVGHSIATTLDGRLFIEAGNRQKLGSTRFFTFEPHIRHHNGKWGFKHEDIYYFDDSGGIVVL